MEIIKCKVCGGDIELSAKKTFGICETCGMPMTLPGNPTEGRTAAYNRGNYFRRTGEFDKAIAVYERLVEEDDTDAEAHWCCALCRFGIEYVEDPAAYEWIPTCHRASISSFLEDADYLAAVEHSDGATRRQYQKEARKIADTQKAILDIARNEMPCDVFLCCGESGENGTSTPDGALTQKLCNQLTERGVADSTASELLNRGSMALENGDWRQADTYFDQVLELAPECAEAYLGKALAAEMCKNLDDYLEKLDQRATTSYAVNLGELEDKDHVAEIVRKYTVPGFLEESALRKLYAFDFHITSTVWEQEKRNRELRIRVDQDRNLSRAKAYAQDDLTAMLTDFRTELEQRLNRYLADAQRLEKMRRQEKQADYVKWLREADNKAFQMHQEALITRTQRFQNMVRRFEKADSVREYVMIKKELKKKWTGFSAADQLIVRCNGAIAEIKEREAAKARSKRRRTIVLAAAASLSILIAVMATVVLICIVIPSENYQAAEALLEAGKYEEAIEAFSRLGGYADRISECKYRAAEALLEAGDYERAISGFAELGDYEDAAERIDAIWNEIVQRETISGGEEFTVALRSNGTVIASGRSYYGQCNVFDWTDIIEISAGGYHTAGLKADGTVVAVGNNECGQCDVSDWTDIVAIRAGDYNTMGLKSDGTVVAVGGNSDGQCEVSDWAGIVAISGGSHHIVGLKSDGTVVAAGGNSYGRCDVSDWTDIVAISAGDYHTIGLKSDGTVVAVGHNGYGQCDVSGWTDIVAIGAGGYHTVGLKSDGTVVAVGEDYDGQCNVSDWTDIVAISGGGYHTIGLKSDGTVVAVGGNDHWQCDVSDWTGIKLPE